MTPPEADRRLPAAVAPKAARPWFQVRRARAVPDVAAVRCRVRLDGEVGRDLATLRRYRRLCDSEGLDGLLSHPD